MPYKSTEKQKEKSKQYYQTHKEKCKESQKQWRIKNPEKIKKYIINGLMRRKEKYQNNLEYRKKVISKAKDNQNKIHLKLRKARDNIILERGGKCEKCGFSDIRALIIHHPFGNHNKHGKKSKNTYAAIREIIEYKVPFTVLCANCHVILHNQKKT